MTGVKVSSGEQDRRSPGQSGWTAAIPLYEQVKREISERILMGMTPPGSVLPGESELAGTYGVSVGTVRRALGELSREGLLSRRRKTGTVVTGRQPHHSLRSFFQYFRLHDEDGGLLRSRAELLSLERGQPTELERQRLEGPPDGVIRICRLRRVDGRVVMHDRMVLSASRLPVFPPPEQVPELLYLHLLNHYGIRISAVRERIRAEAATLEDARLLDLDGAGAVLVIDEVAYDERGSATVWVIHRAVTDRCCYINEVS